jgi:Ca2+-binding EF-hand superfamily protein
MWTIEITTQRLSNSVSFSLGSIDRLTDPSFPSPYNLRQVMGLIHADHENWEPRFKAMFTEFDEDKSGDIDARELGEGLRAIGISLSGPELAAFQADVDEDGGGTLSLKEFLGAVQHKVHLSPPPTDAQRRAATLAFRTVDADLGSEDPAAAGWKKIVQRAVKESKDWRNLVKVLWIDFDLSGDGLIDVEELGKALKLINIKLTPRQLIAFRHEVNGGDNARGISKEEFLVATMVHVNAAAASDPSLKDPVLMLAETAWGKILRFAEENPEHWKENIEKMFDRTGDLNELKDLFERIGVDLPPKQWDAFVRDVDLNDDKSCSLPEFEMAFQQRSLLLNKKNAAKETKKSERGAAPKNKEMPTSIHGFKLAQQSEAIGAADIAWEKILNGVASNPIGLERALAASFAAFDVEGSGALDIIQLASGLRSLGGVILNRDQIRALKVDFDADGDGSITDIEFKIAVRQRLRVREVAMACSPANGKKDLQDLQEAENAWAVIIGVVEKHEDWKDWNTAAQSMFSDWDTNKKGMISASALRTGLAKLGVNLSEAGAASFVASFLGKLQFIEEHFMAGVFTRLRLSRAAAAQAEAAKHPMYTEKEAAEYAQVANQVFVIGRGVSTQAGFSKIHRTLTTIP